MIPNRPTKTPDVGRRHHARKVSCVSPRQARVSEAPEGPIVSGEALPDAASESSGIVRES